MTDKQIIIDDCDVQNCDFFKYCDTDVEFSECLAHWHPNEDYSNVYYAKCDEYPNCYYKQLKRAEKTMQEIWDRLGKTSDELLRKEQECEGLRYEIGSLENDRDILQEQLDQLKLENKHLNDLLNQALKELEKTRETLTEIKEIAENGCYDDCGMPLDELSIILQKISEVECEN